MNTMRRTPVDSKPVRPARFIQVLAFLVACGTLILALASTPFVGPLAFSKDGRSLIGVVNGTWSLNWNDPLSSLGTVKVWNATTGKVRKTLSGPSVWLRTISVSPDGSTLAVAGDSPLIELWNIHTGKRAGILNGHTHNVGTVKFAPSGNLLASANDEGEIRLWNLARRPTRPQIAVDRPAAYDLCFSPDGRSLAVSTSGGIAFLNTKDGQLINETRGDRLGFLGYTKNGGNFLLIRYEGHYGEKKTMLDARDPGGEVFASALLSKSPPALTRRPNDRVRRRLGRDAVGVNRGRPIWSNAG